MKKFIESIDRCTIYEVSYITKFEGCQCYKDCNCYEDWRKAGNPQKVTLYNVFTGRKSHSCKTLEEALKLAEEISKQQNRNEISESKMYI